MYRQVIYRSRAHQVDPRADIDAILVCARRNNPELGLTGALMLTGGVFLQVLEGDEDQMDMVLDTIAGDVRHRQMQILFDRTVATRAFPDWTMGHIPPAGRDSVAGRVLDTTLSDGLTQGDPDVLIGLLRDIAKSHVDIRARV